MVRVRDWIPPYRPGESAEHDAYNTAHRRAFYTFLGIMPGAAVAPGRVEAANAHAHKVASDSVPKPDAKVFLAYYGPRGSGMDPDAIRHTERLACADCRNKTFTITYDVKLESHFPTLACACCGTKCGRMGWAPEE